jgi:hypothetical protein
MDSAFAGILKKLVAEQGESILCEPKRVSAFLSD